MTMKSDILTYEEAHRLFRYDQETGQLFWKIAPRRKPFFIDKQAGGLTGCGYLTVTINQKRHLVHRVIYMMHYGEYPNNEIDHIDGVRRNNRICNLRDVSPTDNRRNMKIYSRNKSGTCGVCRKPNGRWRAYINVNGKHIHLATTKSYDEAVEIRKSAEQKYNFHPNFGRAS